MKNDSKAAAYLSVVMRLLFSIIVSAFAGYFVDKKAGTKGLLMILFILAGVIAGFIWLKKSVENLDKK
jgi:F0F1-type ATP synthase assembly protein I